MEQKIISDSVVFPISVTFEDGTVETYDDVEEIEFDLEHFDSELSPECHVADHQGRKVVLRVELLELKELRLSEE
jgi:hypothetical protein